MSTQFNFKREEKKYFLTPMQYEILRNAVQPYMQADEHEKYTICNLYYDTDDWQLIRTAFCGVQWPLVRWPAATKRR